MTDPDTRSAAFAEYVEPELEVLLRVAQSLTGSWAEAEDLVQDTLIRAFAGIGSFDGAYPRAWLLTIMRRANINAHRRKRPGTIDPFAGMENHTPAFGAAVADNPEDMVLDQVIDAALAQAVAALDPRFRAVLVMVDLDQLSYQETADVLGIPIGTVMSRLSRARSRVRKALGNHGASRRKS